MRNAIRPIGAISAQRNDVVFKREGFSGDRPRGITALALAGLFGLLNSVACGSNTTSSSKEDASLADTSVDRQQGADTWVGPDASMPVGLDASVDTRVNATVDASADATVDAFADATVDAFADASVDVPVTAPVDAFVGPAVDAFVGPGIDAFVGAPIDASVCTLADGGMPGSTCAPGQVCNDGVCQRACGVGQTACTDDVCHDLMNENANCGWCGSECSMDKQCIAGECTCIIPGMCPS